MCALCEEVAFSACVSLGGFGEGAYMCFLYHAGSVIIYCRASYLPRGAVRGD